MLQRFYHFTCLLMTQTFILSHQTCYIHRKQLINISDMLKKWPDADKLASNLDKNLVLFHSPQVSTTELKRLRFGKKQIHQDKILPSH